MKRTLLFTLTLIAVGCADAEQSETPSEGSEQVTPSASCADITDLSWLDYVRTCAERGDAKVQFMLGDMYNYGEGVPEDGAEAVRWYRLAAEQGDASHQYKLGGMYQTGRGVPEDNVLAYMWWNLAAAQGHATAQGDKDIIEQRMTREQIAEAQRLSREWFEAHSPGNWPPSTPSVAPSHT